MEILKKWACVLAVLVVGMWSDAPAQPVGSPLLQNPLQNNEATGASNLRASVSQPGSTEGTFSFDYTYDGILGPTAKVIAVVDLRARKGSSAWFGCDPVTVARGRGTVSIKVRFFDDEEGVPETVTTDRIRLLFLNDPQTVVVGSAVFLKNLTWGKVGFKPARQPAPLVTAAPTPDLIPEAAAKERLEAAAKAEALVKAEAEAKRLAAEKLIAEAKAKEEAEARQKKLALEAQLREEAVQKARAEAERLATEKALAEAKAREEAIERDRQAKLQAKLREESLRKAEAESKRLVDEKAAAEAKAKADEQARIAKEAKDAQLREQARIAAEAEAKRLAQERALAEEKTRKEEEARAKQVALEAKQREEARLAAEAEIKRIADEKALAEKKAKELAEAQAAEALKAQEEARLKAVAEAKRLAEENAKAELKAKQEAEARARQVALEAKQREEARLAAKAEAERLAEEKLVAERKAREEAEAKARQLALEAQRREEARLKAEAETKRLAEEKRVAEAKAREAEEARARQAAIELKQREEARLKVEAEAKRLAEEKALAERKAQEEKEALAKKEAAEAKLREEALAKAEAEANRLAEEKKAAEARAAELAKAQPKPAAPTPEAAAVRPAGDYAPLTASAFLKSKVTNVDVVNRSLDRSRMTFGVEYEYKDDFGAKAEIGLEVLRTSDPESRGNFETTPLEMGKSRRNFLLLPVKFNPTRTLPDANQYNTDKVLVYLRDPKTREKQTLYPATMLLVWRAQGAAPAPVAPQPAGVVEMEDFKQNDPGSGYVSVKYNLPANTPALLRVRIFDAANPDSANYFQPAESQLKGGRGQLLIDVRVDPDNKSPTDYIKADTIEIELIGADKKTISKATRKTAMAWGRPK